MLDGLSNDQLRAFVAAVDEGSFSAAARALSRAQSAISDMVSRLEAQIGVTLFDRSGRYPRLTAEGRVLLGDARAILNGLDGLRARAKGMAAGVEAELSVVFDVVTPMTVITCVAAAFASKFPATPLRLYVEALGSSHQFLAERRVSLGIVGAMPGAPVKLTTERVGGVPFMMVCAPSHPLANYDDPIAKKVLAAHRQLVLTDKSEMSRGKEFYVFAQSTWRLGDLYAKHAFLLAGLGWGGMPIHIIEKDLVAGRLREVRVEDEPTASLMRPMVAAFPPDAPPGPAGRWMIEQVKRHMAIGIPG